MTAENYKRAQEIERQIEHINTVRHLMRDPKKDSDERGGIWISEGRDRGQVYTGWFDTKDDEFYHLIADWLKKHEKNLKDEFDRL